MMENKNRLRNQWTFFNTRLYNKTSRNNNLKFQLKNSIVFCTTAVVAQCVRHKRLSQKLFILTFYVFIFIFFFYSIIFIKCSDIFIKSLKCIFYVLISKSSGLGRFSRLTRRGSNSKFVSSGCSKSNLQLFLN